MRALTGVVALLLTMHSVPAERPVPLDGGFLRDYAVTRGFRLGAPTAIRVVPDGASVLFLRSGPRSATQGLYQFDVASGETRELITAERLLGTGEETLSPEEQARRERMRVSASGFVSFELSDDGRLVLAPLGGRLFLLERATGRVEELRVGGESFDARLSPDGRRVGFIRDHDVWVYDVARRKAWPVTRGGTAEITRGEAEFVAAEEMDRYAGWWWSPDGASILFQEADARGVEVWHVADPAHPEREPRTQYYPRPGRANVQVRLGLVGVRGGRVTWVDWDRERYPYFTRADWHRRGGLTVVVQTRDQRELVLLRVAPDSGRTARLLTETDAAWVNLDPRMPRWLADGSGFLWTSERAGAWQLELRGADGAFQRAIVPPSAGYRGLAHLDDEGRAVIVSASEDPTQTHLFRAALEGTTWDPWTSDAGVHDGVFERGSPVWVHTVSTPGAMPMWVVRRGAANEVGGVVGPLPSLAEDPGFLPRAETLRVGEGEGFHAEVLRPRNFDPARRYPVIVDAYGGPHANMVEAAMSTRLLGQWLAEQGFVVISVDNRGTPRRGRAWERAIAGRLAEVPLADQIVGLRALGARFPELDLGRVGITGWSYGGYLSALAVLRRPDVFRAAVAGAPVTDWLDYDTHYTERYLGVPGPGDTVYAANSLLNDAAGLRRPLLLMHGTGDDNVFFRHSLKLADALFREGRAFELLPLPGLTHMVPDPVVMERRWGLTVGFFQRHLGGPK